MQEQKEAQDSNCEERSGVCGPTPSVSQENATQCPIIIRTGLVSAGVVVIITTFVGETIKKYPVKPVGVESVMVPLPSVPPVAVRT